MDWLTVVVNLVSGTFAGTIASFIATRRIERLKADWNKELQESQNRFSIGVNSHQAQIGFDKRAEFCERYMEEALRILNTRNAADRFVAFDTARLVEIRHRGAIWLPKSATSMSSKSSRKASRTPQQKPMAKTNPPCRRALMSGD